MERKFSQLIYPFVLLIVLFIFVILGFFLWKVYSPANKDFSTRSSERMRLLADIPRDEELNEELIRRFLLRKYPPGTSKDFILENFRSYNVGSDGFFCYKSNVPSQLQLDCSVWAEPRASNETYWRFSLIFDVSEKLQDVRVEIAGFPSF